MIPQTLMLAMIWTLADNCMPAKQDDRRAHRGVAELIGNTSSCGRVQGASGAHPAVVEGAAALLCQVAVGGVAGHDLRRDAVRVGPADLAGRRVQPGRVQVLRDGHEDGESGLVCGSSPAMWVHMHTHIIACRRVSRRQTVVEQPGKLTAELAPQNDL